MPQIYYIDGYNVIHHSSVLRPLAAQSFELARETLIEKVSRYCVASGSQAKIVFDGRGRGKDTSVSPTAQGVEIIYSPGHVTADALIERVVYNATDRRSIIVVSADRGIRNLCGNLNALVMQPDNFLSSVHEADSQTRSTLQHMQKADTQRRVEERLDSKSIDALKALRDKLLPPKKDGKSGK